MKLERLMTVEIDLPDAPDGCEWVLLSDLPQVRLERSGRGLGILTGSGPFGVEAKLYTEDDGTDHPTHREAALELFRRLGLEAKDA